MERAHDTQLRSTYGGTLWPISIAEIMTIEHIQNVSVVHFPLSAAEEIRFCMCELYTDQQGLADTTTFSVYPLTAASRAIWHAYPSGWTGETASTSKRKVALDRDAEVLTLHSSDIKRTPPSKILRPKRRPYIGDTPILTLLLGNDRLLPSKKQKIC